MIHDDALLMMVVMISMAVLRGRTTPLCVHSNPTTVPSMQRKTMALRKRRGNAQSTSAEEPDPNKKNDEPTATSTKTKLTKRPFRKRKHYHTTPSRNSPLINPKTIQGSAILILTMFTGVLWNWFEEQKRGPAADPHVATMLQAMCQQNKNVSAYCHSSLSIASRRTHKAIKEISPGEIILTIPRSLQIWLVDALVDNWVIRNELVRARTAESKRPLAPAAFLAAHLALMPHNVTTNHAVKEEDSLLNLYWKVLPTYQDYQEFHPLFWKESELQDLLGGYSSTYAHVRAFREMIQEEYDSFVKVSSVFAHLVSEESYKTCRLHVMTRSFGTGPDASNALLFSGHETAAQTAAKAAGISLEGGFHAMVPILDLYNHHARPNVGFSYDSTRQAFVIKAISTIVAGQEIIDSYGKRTDSDLFARYGFVNGDGSDWTQASLALWHRVKIHPENQTTSVDAAPAWSTSERFMIARYLQYDDGYKECVVPSNQEAWEFKRIKYQYLLAIAAADESRWVFHMSPRRPNQPTPMSTDHLPTDETPPDLNLQTLQFDGNAVFGTCRLLSLTHYDYDNNATNMLRHALQSESTQSTTKSKPYSWLPPTLDGLEYRTLLCVARMASTVQSRFGVAMSTLQQQVVAEPFQSKNWTAAHLRLGEIQSLDMLKQVAFSGMRRLFGSDAMDSMYRESDDNSFRMRDKPCPARLLQLLVDEALHNTDSVNRNAGS